MNSQFVDTQHHIPGCLVAACNMYAYIDFAFGKNQAWLINSFEKGCGVGDSDKEWNLRFNINYYF